MTEALIGLLGAAIGATGMYFYMRKPPIDHMAEARRISEQNNAAMEKQNEVLREAAVAVVQSEAKLMEALGRKPH
ncbi:MAG: hypothetical protein IKE42_28460 [Aquamicrobium sp.]|nr:hypothetical protein [Aquamicrobium sp.]